VLEGDAELLGNNDASMSVPILESHAKNRLNAIHPADSPGHVISQISETSCDYVELVKILSLLPQLLFDGLHCTLPVKSPSISTIV
jgi:hypothetical protein